MTRQPGAWRWLAAACLAVPVALAAPGLALYWGIDVDQRPLLLTMARDAAPVLFYALAIVLVVAALAAHAIYRRYPLAAQQLAEQARGLQAAGSGYRVDAGGARPLGEVALAINQLADAYRRLEGDLESRAVETRIRVEEERDRFAALMSELTQGVLVCNVDGRILLYNPRAAALLGAGENDAVQSAFAPVGLGRSVFALLDRNQVTHALDKIHHQMDTVERPQARFVATAANGALLRVQVAPFLSADGRVAGMVFALDDVRSMVGREGRRLKLMQALATGVRAPVANLRAAAENLAAYPDMPESQRAQFVDIVVTEARGLTERLNAAMSDYADALKGSLTLEDMRVADLLAVVQRQLVASADVNADTEPEAAASDLWVRVDSYAIVQAFVSLAARVSADYKVRSFRLRAQASGSYTAVDLVWFGTVMSSEVLMFWENEPMRVGADESLLTLKDVLERHGGEVWYQVDRPRHTAWFRFLLPAGEPAVERHRPQARLPDRPEYYDFDLFDRLDTHGLLAERPLAALSYTVFDTETTGLEPSAGDEIISIGAVRIVNGRLLKHDVFEQLINPRRSISRESTLVHGIDARALAGEPPIEDVLPRFHRFCEDTVLVAHNAAFDMRFLELKQATTGVRFEQPVLDTLLLSALVYPSAENHNLDPVAERLGVRVIGRHTALGDALVTGEVLVRLLPLLADRGIRTLGQALEASRATYLARLQY